MATRKSLWDYSYKNTLSNQWIIQVRSFTFLLVQLSRSVCACMHVGGGRDLARYLISSHILKVTSLKKENLNIPAGFFHDFTAGNIVIPASFRQRRLVICSPESFDCTSAMLPLVCRHCCSPPFHYLCILFPVLLSYTCLLFSFVNWDTYLYKKHHIISISSNVISFS